MWLIIENTSKIKLEGIFDSTVLISIKAGALLAPFNRNEVLIKNQHKSRFYLCFCLFFNLIKVLLIFLPLWAK